MRPDDPRGCETRAIRLAGHRSALALLAAVALVAGCGTEEPKSAAVETDLRAELRGAPAELRRVNARANAILDGGADGFRRQLRALRGTPVVVNRWASWCRPCRAEFPFFQRLAVKHAGEVAFLGVDSRDSKDAAREFLDEFPVPYPSFFDPDGDVAELFDGDRSLPTTAFYDRGGDLALTKQGPYTSEKALAGDIARYAPPGRR